MSNKALGVVSLIFTLCLQVGMQESSAQQDHRNIFEAAEAGDAHAQFLLGNMYNSGRGQRKDVKQAFKWFREAANQGHSGASFNLGVMFERGRGTSKDIKKAVKWYRAAANAGNTDAMYTLSLMYDEADSFPKNEKRAEDWYNRAIDQQVKGDQSRSNRVFLRHEQVDIETDSNFRPLK